MISIDSIAGQIATQLPQTSRIGSRQLEQAGQALGSSSTGAATGAGSFGKTIGKFVGEVDTQMKTSQAERTKVMSGESSNLHQAVIASQESNIAFTFMVELRNKLVESYQELMRAQV